MDADLLRVRRAAVPALARPGTPGTGASGVAAQRRGLLAPAPARSREERTAAWSGSAVARLRAAASGADRHDRGGCRQHAAGGARCVAGKKPATPDAPVQESL